MQRSHPAWAAVTLSVGVALLALLLIGAPAQVLGMFACAVIAALAVLTHRWDQFAVLCAIASVPVAGVAPLLTWVAGLPMVAGALWTLWTAGHRRDRAPVTVDPMMVVLALLVCAQSVVTFAASGDRSDLGPVLLGGGLLVLVACTGIYLSAASTLVRVIDATVLGATLMAVVYLVYAVPRTQGIATWTDVYEEWSWINPNALAAIFAIAFAASLGAAIAGLGKVHLIGSSVSLLALLFTFSRATYLAVLVVLIVVVLLRLRRAWVLAPLVAAIIVWIPDSVRERVLYTTASGTLDASSATRLDLWHLAWSTATTRPLLGSGIHSIGDTIAQEHGRAGLVFFHNTYLTALVALGLPLFCVVMASLARWLVQLAVATLRRREHTPQLFVASVAVIVSIFGEPLFHPTTATIVAAIALVRPTDRTRSAISNPSRLRDGRRRDLAVRASP